MPGRSCDQKLKILLCKFRNSERLQALCILEMPEFGAYNYYYFCHGILTFPSRDLPGVFQTTRL